MTEFTIQQEESLDPSLQLIRIHDALSAGESGMAKLGAMLNTPPEPGSAAEQLLGILNYTVPAGKVVNWYVHIHLKLSDPPIPVPEPEPEPIPEGADPNVTP